MKTVLFVPGFSEDMTTRDYQSVIEAIKNKGYDVTFVPIQWKRTTIADWIVQLEKVYAAYDPAKTILAGFSYGAMTAFVVASKRQPAELWLFSLSPYFSEDLGFLKPVWLHQIGKRRTGQFWQVSFDELYPKMQREVKLFAGEKEMKKYKAIARRFEDAAAKLQHCTAVTVSGAGHEVEHPNYIEAISENI